MCDDPDGDALAEHLADLGRCNEVSLRPDNVALHVIPRPRIGEHLAHVLRHRHRTSEPYVMRSVLSLEIQYE